MIKLIPILLASTMLTACLPTEEVLVETAGKVLGATVPTVPNTKALGLIGKWSSSCVTQNLWSSKKKEIEFTASGIMLQTLTRYTGENCIQDPELSLDSPPWTTTMSANYEVGDNAFANDGVTTTVLDIVSQDAATFTMFSMYQDILYFAELHTSSYGMDGETLETRLDGMGYTGFYRLVY